MDLREARWALGSCVMDVTLHLGELPVERRLALTYAPGPARPIILGLLALDTRLAGIVRQAREPLLGQLRLSWWRDRLGPGGPSGTSGDPLLDLLDDWGDQRGALAGLADGWEHLLNETQLDSADLVGFTEARAKACAAMAERLGESASATEAARAGRNWAVAELAAKLSDPVELELAAALAAGQDWRAVRLPRALRPLTVLHGLSRRSRGTAPLLSGPIDGLVAVRLGLLGI